jgi:hypothetical protein
MPNYRKAKKQQKYIKLKNEVKIFWDESKK